MAAVELPRLLPQRNQGYSRIVDVEAPIKGEETLGGSNPTSVSKSFLRNGFVLLASGTLLLVLALLSGFNNYAQLQQAVISKITPYRVASHSETPSPLWGVVAKPYPTGAFWTNLVVKNGDGPIAVYPYGIKALETGIQVSYGAFRRMVSSAAINDLFMYDLNIAATQSYVSRAVEAYDNVSVTMGYKTASNGKFRAHLVKSTPYVTVYYENATPVISAQLMRIIAVEAKLVKDSPGVQYVVTLANYQKWLVFCSEQVIFNWKENSLTASAAIKGVVRVAFLPVQNSDAALTQLLAHAPRYPTGGVMTFSYPTPTQAVVTIQYTAQGTGPLLMLALPHHLPLLAASHVDSAESKKVQAVLTPLWCIKGRLKAVVGETWKLTYNLASVGWNYALQDKLTTTQLDEIARYLFSETKVPTVASGDIYAFGKQIGRMARLALIADNLGIAEARQQALSNLEQWVIPWLQGMNSEPLVYDRVYGGLVTAQGLADMTADFGAGWYNDHHFQFGYFVNAVAVLAKLDMPFYEANKPALDAFVRDICNPDPSDLDFPLVRHKDFFDGHSWASGIFQQGNGKGQESSSESVNAYYGAYLFANAVGNVDFQKFTLLLLSMEIQATQTYWHMGTDDIYDSIFAAAKMVGNIGALDVTSSTWFGNDLEYVHGINMMPLSPVTAVLFDLSYVQQQFAVLAPRVTGANSNIASSPLCEMNAVCKSAGLKDTCCPNQDGVYLACCTLSNIARDEWRALTLADYAILDKEAAWTQILELPSFGSGNSRANSLFWTASRPPPVPGFNSSALIEANRKEPLVKSSCASNSACDAIGMTNECCPSYEGSFLGCCPHMGA